ncbi:putative Ig domain-containing protein, partial [Roseibium sp.]
MPEYTTAELDRVYDLYEWAASVWPSSYTGIPNVARNSNNDYLIKQGFGFGLGPDTLFDLNLRIQDYEVFDDFDSQDAAELKDVFIQLFPTGGTEPYPVNTNAAWSPYHGLTWQRAVQVAIKEIFEVTCNARITKQYAEQWIASIGDVYASSPQDAALPLHDGVNLEGTSDDETICSGDGNDTIEGFAGDDILHGRGGEDTLIGGDGEDFLYGGEDADELFGDDNQDQLFGEAGEDVLHGGAGNDILFGGTGADELSGDSGQDELFGESGNDVLGGGVGNDLLYGGTGSDKLSGGTGQDELEAEAGDDVLEGGVRGDMMPTDTTAFFASLSSTLYYDDGQSDILDGGAGYDVYYVYHVEKYITDSTDWENPRSGADPYGFFDAVFIGYDYGGVVQQKFDTDDFAHVDRIRDSDGVGDIILQGPDSPDGLSNPPFNVTSGDFTKWSTYGVDLYFEDRGSRVFYYSEGDLYGLVIRAASEWGSGVNADWFGLQAHFVIEDFSNGDFGLNLPIGQQGSDGDDTPTLTPSGTGEGVDYSGGDGDDVVYGTYDGDTLRGDAGNDELDGAGGDDDLAGGSGDDTIEGGDGFDEIFGGDGNDTLSGGNDGDQVYGGDGNDTINGGNGSDALNGQAGTDLLIGGNGADNYFFGKGGGNDTIREDGASSENDTLNLSGIGIDDVALRMTGENNKNLLITILSTGETILVEDQFAPSGSSDTSIERIDISGTRENDYQDDAFWTESQIRDLALAGTPDNTAPTVSNPIADLTSQEDAAWSFVVPAGTFTDADGDALTYSATLSDGSALPAWLSFDADTRTFSGTPPQDFNGTLSLKVI